jgi:endonuclease/exonuclease/phosphatase (EEP) superfamily protein YafD
MPTLDARFTGEPGTFRLLATHLISPSTPGRSRGQERQVDDIIRLVGDGREPLLLIGDLNITPWSRLWTRLVGATGLKGAPGIVPTWPSPLQSIGIPIDHMLGKNGVWVVKAWTGPAVGSDHRPLIAEVRIPR